MREEKKGETMSKITTDKAKGKKKMKKEQKDSKYLSLRTHNAVVSWHHAQIVPRFTMRSLQ
jgi:hypothetical protein